MHLLVAELFAELGSQAAVSRATGLGNQYVNQMFHLHDPDAFGPKGISADVIQQLVDNLALDPMFFFDHWRPGEVRSYRAYLRSEPTSAEALGRRVRELSEQLQTATQKLLNARK